MVLWFEFDGGAAEKTNDHSKRKSQPKARTCVLPKPPPRPPSWDHKQFPWVPALMLYSNTRYYVAWGHQQRTNQPQAFIVADVNRSAFCSVHKIDPLVRARFSKLAFRRGFLSIVGASFASLASSPGSNTCHPSALSSLS